MVWMSTGLDWALPPPATTIIKDMPAFASGTTASMVIKIWEDRGA